jgi:hypothetical protein
MDISTVDAGNNDMLQKNDIKSKNYLEFSLKILLLLHQQPTNLFPHLLVFIIVPFIIMVY